MRFYYGWRIVAVAAAIYVLVFGSTVSSFSLYVVPVSAEYGLTRAQMNTAFVLINVGSAFWAPFIGAALDRYSLRLILAGSAVLMGLGFLALALFHSIWISAFVLAVAIAIGLDGAAMLTMTVLVARWFKVHRARAMTLAVTGQAMGKVLIPVPTALLIEGFGWRVALVVTGLILIVVLLLVATFMRDRPGPEDKEPGSDIPAPVKDDSAVNGETAPGNVRYFLAMPRFWLIAIGIALTYGISASFAISVVPVGMDFGLTLAQGAVMASVYAGAAVSAKLALAVFADKVERFTLIIALLLIGIPLFLSFLAIEGPVQLFVFVIFLGLSVGGFAALFPVLQADVFGLASYGTVRGLMIPIQSAVVAIGAIGVGEIHDVWANYDLMFVSFAVAQAIAAALLYLARSQVKVAARSDSGKAVS